jgi:hypothetical protein
MKQILLALMLLLSVVAVGQGREERARISFGKLENGATTTIAELLAQQGFTAEDTNYKVQSFVLSVQFQTGDVSGIHRIKGDRFDSKGRGILERVAGTRGTIYLEEIKVLTPELYTWTLHPFRFRFTE